ncbi:hypothetical protein B0T10DRAFT_579357 [Thelonectria olida]|uniref:C2H2-type domain-containing protein n=1 Tax=Thelonectria olida TaxID=1576542 RepID=A0A9P8VXV3_9HYPO|nr:hypothetical protein B0T10DRAFT_579357 [Thelonectria olida]
MTTFSTQHLRSHPFRSLALKGLEAPTPSTQLQSQMMEDVFEAARSLLSSGPRQRWHAKNMNPSSDTSNKKPHEARSQNTHSTPTSPRRKAAEKQDDAKHEPSRDDDDKDKMHDSGHSPRLGARESRLFACPIFKATPRGHLHHPEGQECLHGWSGFSSVSRNQKEQIQELPDKGSEADKWCRAYRIIFPDAQNIPSPYYDENETSLRAREALVQWQNESGDSVASDTTHREVVPTAIEPERLPDLLESFGRINPALWTNDDLERRNLLIGEILTSVHVWLSSELQNNPSSSPGTPCCNDEIEPLTQEHSSTSNAEVRQNRHKKPTRRPQRGRKRKRGKDKGNGDDEEEGEGDGSGGSPNEEEDPTTKAKKLACPFLKMFPWIYIHRKPCLGAWNISRLKEHLFRQHLEPEICNRCFEMFDDRDELIEHQRADTPCPISERREPRGIDGYQERLLRSKKHGNEQEKIRRIYKTLWPKTPESDFPNPYWSMHDPESVIEPSGNELYQYLSREMPPLLRVRLETNFPLDETIHMSRVIETVQEAFQELFERFLSGYRATPGETSPQIATNASLSEPSQTPQPQPASLVRSQQAPPLAEQETRPATDDFMFGNLGRELGGFPQLGDTDWLDIDPQVLLGIGNVDLMPWQMVDNSF